MEDHRIAVVIEDDDDIRGLIVALLGQSGFEVIATSNGTDGVTAAREFDPVLITVDLGLPDIDGYEVTRRVRQFTDAYVVMLTARTEEIDTLIGLDAGADDYLTKPFRPRVLRARIQAMMRRPRASQASVPASSATPATPAPGVPVVPAAAGGPSSGPGSVPGADAGRRLNLEGLELFPDLHLVEAEGRAISLTPTEFLLLETLMRSGRVVRSKAELSRIIRGDEPDHGNYVSAADERTVEVHLGNLRRKLGDSPKSPRWVQTVRGVGYRMAGSPQLLGWQPSGR
ncbi:response regulator transcription factor [Citricoccus muralis]|uniref:DNA-binding response OmpR family regulator n=1 Tax=Citricoccus muralis TaxID=169134 RepID=A0A3D9LF01_9MICC|nr:response regulator transcription factor [Citricoccus muralis]REE03713.1 DNA-binding response OmpR family regulator [Citricoccus muralis]